MLLSLVALALLSRSVQVADLLSSATSLTTHTPGEHMRNTNRLLNASLALLALLTISCAHAHTSCSQIEDEEETYVNSPQNIPTLKWEPAGRFLGLYEIYTTTTSTGEVLVKLERYCDESCATAKRRLNIVMERLHTALAEPTTPALTLEAVSIYYEADAARNSYIPDQMEETTERVQQLTDRIETEKRRLVRNKLRICLSVGLLAASLFAAVVYRRRQKSTICSASRR